MWTLRVRLWAAFLLVLLFSTRRWAAHSLLLESNSIDWELTLNMLKIKENSLSQALKPFWHSLSIYNWYRKTNNLLKAALLWITFHSCVCLQDHLDYLLWNFHLFPISAIGTRPKASSRACQDPDAKLWNIPVATSGLLVSYTGSCVLSAELPQGVSHGQRIYWYLGWGLSKETFVFLLTLDM